MKTIAVTPGLRVDVDMPSKGAVRFERHGGSMTGDPVYAVEGDALVLKYTDGSSVYIKS